MWARFARITATAVSCTDLAAHAAWWAEELDRLLALGATPVDVGQGPLTEQMTWHVLADPEGNEFCLLGSRVAPL